MKASLVNELDLDLEQSEFSEREVDQALLDLKNFGVLEHQAFTELLKRDLAFGYYKWAKPIPWALSFCELTESGQERVLSVEIEELSKPVEEQFITRDLFKPNEIGLTYSGHLGFHPGRIKEVIASGHYRELARVCTGQLFLGNDKLRSEKYPEIFPVENADV